MKPRTLNLDLDGVIVDLDTFVIEQTGTHWREQQSSTYMWSIIREKAPNLFLDAAPMPDAHILIEGVLTLAAEHDLIVEILTAVPEEKTLPGATEHKQVWLKKHFPKLAALTFKTGPHAIDKQKHATPGDILIDDNKRNIAQWDAVGGVAIFHVDAATSLQQLQDVLKAE